MDTKQHLLVFLDNYIEEHKEVVDKKDVISLENMIHSIPLKKSTSLKHAFEILHFAFYSYQLGLTKGKWKNIKN